MFKPIIANITTLLAMAAAELIYLPIHNQILNWGVADAWQTVGDADDQVIFRYFALT